MNNYRKRLKMRSKQLGITLFLLVILSYFLIVYPSIAQTVKIGVEIPLTGYGAIYGEDAKRALEVAVHEVNMGGGIHGKRVEVVFQDDGGIGKTAIAATQ